MKLSSHRPCRLGRSRFSAAVAVIVGASVIGSVSTAVQAAANDPGVDFNLSVAGTLLRDGSTVNESTTVKVGASSLLKEGTGNRELQVHLDPGFVYQSGGVTAPEGWTVQYSTDNGISWGNSEPSPASNVTDVRATKSALAAGPIVNGSQIFSSETVTAIPASTFAGSTGGDGWDVFFYENYVLNIFHHQSGYVALNCLLRTTGTLCPGFNPTQTSGAAYSRFSGYMAGNRSGGWALTTTGRVYAFTSQVSTSTPGVLCIDVTTAPPTNCGFIALSSATNVNAYSYLSNAEGAGGRLFGMESVNQKLLCYDPVTNAACVGSPISVSGTNSPTKYHVYPLGDRVFASTDTTLYCYNTDDLTPCAGSWPVTYSSLSWTSQTISPVAHMNSSGTINGVCMWNGCLDLTGAAKSGAGWTNPHSVTAWSGSAANNTWSGQYGRFEATSGRAFLHRVLQGTQEVFCFDYVTDAACAGFDTTPKPADVNMYALRVDPNNPACVWYNSDPGRIGLFDAFTGEASCAGNPVITLQPSSFAPRYACSTTKGVDEWTLVKLKSVAGTGTASSIKMTIRDPLGDPVAGWTNKPVTIGTSYDMTGLDVGTSGSRPTFNFAFTGVTGGSITSATVSLDYMGKGPELCVNTVLSAGGSACPVVSGTTTKFIDSVGTSATYTKTRSLTIGTNPAACAQNLRAMAPPGPPRNPDGTPQTSTTAKVVFDIPSDDGGSPITEYKYSVDNGSTWQTLTPTTRGDGKLEFTLGSLSSGNTYSVKLLAVNAVGRSTTATASVVMPSASSTPVVAAASTTTTVAAAPATTVALALAEVSVTPTPTVKAIPQSGMRYAITFVVFGACLVAAGAAVSTVSRRRRGATGRG